MISAQPDSTAEKSTGKIVNARTARSIRAINDQPVADIPVVKRSEGRRKMKKDLTGKQSDILAFIETYIDANNWPPTVREIQKALTISSTSVVDYNLDKLEKKGLIIRKGGMSRAIELVSRTTRRNGSELVPMLGTIAAGEPFPERQDQDPEDKLEIPSHMLNGRPGKDVFALKVKGNSMIDALIDDGDIVLIRSSNTAEQGEIVAVRLEAEGETTLKMWFPELQQNRIRLQPANSTLKPIYTSPDNVSIKGKLVGVIRSY